LIANYLEHKLKNISITVIGYLAFKETQFLSPRLLNNLFRGW